MTDRDKLRKILESERESLAMKSGDETSCDSFDGDEDAAFRTGVEIGYKQCYTAMIEKYLDLYEQAMKLRKSLALCHSLATGNLNNISRQMLLSGYKSVETLCEETIEDFDEYIRGMG